MVGKRKPKVAKPKHDDLAKPSKWRLQHGGFSEPVREADPETGSPVQHRRAVDTLGLMLAHGSITPQMHEAGEIFRGLFRAACFDSMSTSQIMRVPGTRVDTLSSMQVEARRRVAAALDALGGQDSPCGSCAWFVIGLEFSVREWSMRQGWAGRTVHGPVGQGILVGSLGILAVHFGLMPRARAA
jgi:hypothetical protein